MLPFVCLVWWLIAIGWFPLTIHSKGFSFFLSPVIEFGVGRFLFNLNFSQYRMIGYARSDVNKVCEVLQVGISCFLKASSNLADFLITSSTFSSSVIRPEISLILLVTTLFALLRAFFVSIVLIAVDGSYGNH